jgi:hypothetical protein
MVSLDVFAGTRPAPVWQKVWLALLVAVTALATGVFACITPLAAAAALCAVTLNRRDALIGVALVWLGNQMIGYGIAGYPATAESFSWGAAIGVASLAATFVAGEVVAKFRNAPLRLVVAFIAAFAVYEVLLAGVAVVLGGLETFAPNIVLYFAGINAIWAVAFALGYLVLAEVVGTRSGTVRRTA